MLKSGFFNVEIMKNFLLLVVSVFTFCPAFLLGNAYRDYILRGETTNFSFQEGENFISEEEKAQILETLNTEVLVSEKEKPSVGKEKSDAQKFVGSLKSDKFYSVDCSYAKRVKEENKVWFSSVEEGETAGRTFVDCQK